MHRYFRVILLVVLLTAPIFAGQSQNNVSSPFTRYGVGALKGQHMGRSEAMGGTAFALRSSSNMNPANPASYTAIDSLSQIFEFGVSGSNTWWEIQNAERQDQDFNFEYLAMGFPVTKWWGSGFGILPFSHIGYDYTADGSTTISADEKVNSLFSHEGKGGLSQVFLGNSFKINNQLSVGVNAYYLFGDINHDRMVSFPEDPSYFGIHVNENLNVSDFYYRLGMQYTQPLKDNRSLTLGLIWSPEKAMNATTTKTVERRLMAGSAPDVVSNDVNKKTDLILPQTLGAGLAFESNKLTVALDYEFQQWSKTQFINEEFTLNDQSNLAMGLEYIPNNRSKKFLNRVAYRLGGHHTNTYYKVGTDDVVDFGMSFGVGLPMRHSKTNFNFALEWGRRQTQPSKKYQEDYLMFTVNFSLNDIWFMKRKFD